MPSGVYRRKKRPPFSKEWIEKLSKSHKGQKAWNKGKNGVYSKKTLKKMSAAKKGKDPWNKGRSLTEEELIQHKISRIICRANDKYDDVWFDPEYRKDLLGESCEFCEVEKIYKGSRHNLVNHHIDPDSKDSSPQNIMTLCRRCHAKLHAELCKEQEFTLYQSAANG